MKKRSKESREGAVERIVSVSSSSIFYGNLFRGVNRQGEGV